MAKRKPKKRIEPVFDGANPRRTAADELRADPKDRKAPARRKKPAKGRGRAKRKSRKLSLRQRLFAFTGRLAYWGIVLAIWGGIAGAGLVAYYGAQMPAAATWSIPDRPPNVKIVDVSGRLIANRGVTGGEAIGLNEMSPYLPQAVIAIEDRRFRDHIGIDIVGLARAFVTNAIHLRLVQGGSTLTQQLAKNLFLKPERTIKRKVQEVLLALWLEHKFTKDQILQMYLNRVYFGAGAYGVEAASRRYFDKPARDLTLAQAATLAGLLKAPSRLSPAAHPKAAEERAQVVLAAMREENMISDSEMAGAISAPAKGAPGYWTGSENYVADHIMSELPKLIGTVRSDIIVDTTIDLGLQKRAENAIRRLVEKNRKSGKVSQGALVSIDGSGAVRAMVGGYDYSSSQYDRAADAKRQPGSAFKPFVYLTALEHGMTPDTIRNDVPVRIGKWTPENYAGKYYGQVTLTTALSKSLNSVAAQLTAELGPKSVIETAHRLGIQSKLEANNSIALGTSEVSLLELASAYIPFANGGYRPEDYFVRRITTTSGQVLYDHRAGAAPRVIRPEIVGMMNSMMEQTVNSGTARRADFGWPAAGKTGTTQNFRDAWFIGYTANLTTGVWFGNDNGKPMHHVTGGSLPASAWRDFMEAAHKGVPVAQLPGTWGQSQYARDQGVSDGGFTASTDRTVPPASVGQSATSRKSRSIFDIIFGSR
jgi:penicillin-binding protein 1A